MSFPRKEGEGNERPASQSDTGLTFHVGAIEVESTEAPVGYFLSFFLSK